MFLESMVRIFRLNNSSLYTGHWIVVTAAGKRSGKLTGSKAKCIFVPQSRVKYNTIETVFNYWSAAWPYLLWEETYDFFSSIPLIHDSGNDSIPVEFIFWLQCFQFST